MIFSELAEYFEKLEQTSSRLALIDILSELFKKTKETEIAEVSYLIQGRVAPFYEPIEIGMSEQLVAESISRAFGIKREEVLKDYRKLGDLGLVAKQLSDKQHATSNMQVTVVFETLKKIAQFSGEGTVGKKLDLLTGLIKQMDPVSSKHLTRIPLGNTRLGIGDPTILDAMAKAKLGDKVKRPLLEDAYNKTSDLGLIGETLWKEGLEGVKKLTVHVGRPIRSQLAERLPDAKKILEKFGGEAHIQYKYDGFRCVGGYTPIYVKEEGITSMRDLQIGDLVLTKTGAFKKVLAKHKRTIKKGERLFEFQTYLGEEIKISEGHPILCLKDNKEVWVNVESISAGDEVIFPVPMFPANNPHPAPEKLELKTRSGYRKTFFLKENFYRFLGFWIGDGFTNYFHNTERVGLTFNAKTETKLADDYEQLIKRELQVPNITRYLHNGGLNIYWRDEPLRHWLSKDFRKEWTGKTLPQWFVHVSEGNFKQFLKGWIESDGSVDKDGVTKIITKERDLAALAQLIALSHGIVVGLHYIRTRIKKGTPEEYSKTYYQLVIPKTTRKARIENGRLIVKVMKNNQIKKIDPRVQLYDIQVENDESFCVPMMSLHNCQIHKEGDKIRLFSRNLEETTNSMPDVVKGALAQIKAKTAILDSEALAFNPASEEFLPFQETTKRRRKYNVAEMAIKLPLKSFVFDAMYINGESLIDLTLRERMEKLKKVIEDGDTLIAQPGEFTKSEDRITELFNDALTKGLEGLVCKKPESKYEAGARNFNWVKLKRHSAGELKDTIDCVILGYISGKGKRVEFGAGSLLVGVYDDKKDEFVTISKIGTGLTDEEWREIHKRADKIKVDHKPARVNAVLNPTVWIKPEIVIEVLADEITRSPIHTAGKTDSEPGYALRFPRLVKFREADKRAEDATTVKEIAEMYKQQYERSSSAPQNKK